MAKDPTPVRHEEDDKVENKEEDVEDTEEVENKDEDKTEEEEDHPEEVRWMW